MEESLHENQEIEISKTGKEDQLATEFSPNDVNVSDMLATLKSIKTEEQELLSKRQKLQTTQKELLGQVISEIDTKRKAVAALKSEVVFLQNKCNELERAIGIPVYE